MGVNRMRFCYRRLKVEYTTVPRQKIEVAIDKLIPYECKAHLKHNKDCRICVSYYKMVTQALCVLLKEKE